MFFLSYHAKTSLGSKSKSDQRKFDFFRKLGLKNRQYGHKNGPFRLESRPNVHKMFNPLSQKRFTRNRAQRGVTTMTSSQLLLRQQPRAH